MRKILALAGAALGIAAIGVSWACSNYSGPGGAQVPGQVAQAAVAAAASAHQTPPFPAYRTPTPEPSPGDNASLDLLLRALYGGVSHNASTEPDWERLQALFVPGARLMPPQRPGDPNWRSLSFDEFREASRQGIAARRQQGKPAGFFEREIGRETVAYGDFTVVLSAYEARFRADDPKPFLRGVNSIQAVRAGDRWAILSIVWDTEGPESPIPDRFLRAP
jgi:hypothetical protein